VTIFTAFINTFSIVLAFFLLSQYIIVVSCRTGPSQPVWVLFLLRTSLFGGLMQHPNFADTIRMHRKKAGLTQKTLADLAGVGKTAVWNVEAGKQTVQLNILLALLDTLNIRIHLESPLMVEAENAKR